MPRVKIYIHFVWSIKDRFPFLNTIELRNRMWQHIKENGNQKNIYIDVVNGHADHCHCMISLGASQAIEKIVQFIKGESSYWINKQVILKNKFEWQAEYFAVSVCESQVEAVRNYILNQESHHRSKSYQEEYDEMMKKFGFSGIDGASQYH